MKISFSPKEYARLLELVHLGMQVVTAHQGFETPEARRYAEIERRVLDLATPFGCADLVDVGADGLPVPSAKLTEDERLRKIRGDYDNDTFWHELVNRLSDRDLAAQQTQQQIAGEGGPPLDAEARLRELEDAYWEEFQKNDLSRLVLLKGGAC